MPVGWPSGNHGFGFHSARRAGSKSTAWNQNWEEVTCEERLSTGQLQGLRNVLMKWVGDPWKGQCQQQPLWAPDQEGLDGTEEGTN